MIFFTYLKTKILSMLFKKETIQYVKKVNEFRSEGMKSKWQETVAIKLPIDKREKYAHDVYSAILKFNKKDDIQKLKDLFPPQTEIFYSLTKEKETVSDIHKIIAVSDEIFLVAVDEPKICDKQKNRVLLRSCYVCERGVFTKLQNVIDFGVCPQKRVFSYVESNIIVLKNTWDGDVLCTVTLSTHKTIYFTDGSIAHNNFDASNLLGECYIPFSDGKRILVSSQDFGLLLLEDDEIKVIFPTKQEYINYKNDQYNHHSVNNFPDMGDFPMFHVSLSHNNKFIALGYQSSNHSIYSVDGVLLGEVSPNSSYPHYALFSKQDHQVMFNSCHFYNGATLACEFEDIILNESIPENKIIELDMESRVYAAVSTSYGYIIGDADGYIRARSYAGDYLWDDYLGFNIQTMDITTDEMFLYVGTYKGIIYKIHLNYGEKSPYQIGNSTNKEVSRWMFWEEDHILRW